MHLRIGLWPSRTGVNSRCEDFLQHRRLRLRQAYRSKRDHQRHHASLFQNVVSSEVSHCSTEMSTGQKNYWNGDAAKLLRLRSLGCIEKGCRGNGTVWSLCL